MYHIALCDDSEYDLREISLALRGLERFGVKYDERWYTSGRELIDDFAEGEGHYHLLILDMLMDSIDGIETAKALREYDVSLPILIVTSTVQYALAGYQVNAWRYLTKPVDPDELASEVYAALKDSEATDGVRFTIANDSGLTRVRLSKILYFESSLHTITLHTMQETLSFRGTIKGVEEQLRDRGFFRIHKSFVVNLRHVKSLRRAAVQMVNGDELDVARPRAQALREALMDEAEREHARTHRGRGRM